MLSKPLPTPPPSRMSKREMDQDGDVEEDQIFVDARSELATILVREFDDDQLEQQKHQTDSILESFDDPPVSPSDSMSHMNDMRHRTTFPNYRQNFVQLDGIATSPPPSESDSFQLVGAGKVNARTVSFRSLSPSEKALTDQRMMVELQLLDAIGKPALRRYSTSTSNLGTIADIDLEAADEDSGDIIGNSPAYIPSDTPDVTSKPRVISRFPSLHVMKARAKARNWRKILLIFCNIFFLLILLAFGVMMLFFRCDNVGCSREFLYEELRREIFVDDGENSMVVLSSKSLSRYPSLLNFNSYILSTLPSNLSYPLQSGQWVIKNLEMSTANAEAIVNDTVAVFPMPSFPSQAFESNPGYERVHASSLGPAFCGRMAHDSPILGFLPTSAGRSIQQEVTTDNGIQISDFDTAVTRNTTDAPLNMLNITAEDLPACCLEFVDTRGVREFVRRRDVEAHLICESGQNGAGGVWTGWKGVVDIPSDAWINSVRAGNYLLFGPQASGKSSETTIAVSSVDDAEKRRGLTIRSKVGINRNLYPGWNVIFPYDTSSFIDSQMDAVFNFAYSKNMPELDHSEFKFGFSRENIDTAGLVPSPWFSTTLNNFAAIRFQYSAEPQDFQVILGGQSVNFKPEGCPNDYLKFNSVCWGPGTRLVGSHMVNRDPLFAEPNSYIPNWFNRLGVRETKLLNATIVRTKFSAAKTSESDDSSVVLRRFAMQMKVRLNDSPAGKKKYDAGKLFLMLDGSTSDSRLGDPMISALDRTIDSSEFKMVDLENRIGGEWTEIEFQNGVARYQNWSEISSIPLKTSGRTGNVVLAFLPSDDFTKSNRSLQILFSPLEVPFEIAAPLEYTIAPNIEPKDWHWKSVVRAHSTLSAIFVKTMNAMINKTEYFSQSQETNLLYKKDERTSIIVDALALSGTGLPPKQSYQRMFGTTPQLLTAAKSFVIPVLSTDIVPRKTVDLWGQPQTHMSNDTVGFFAYHESNQPLLAKIRDTLNSPIDSYNTSLSQRIVHMAAKARDANARGLRSTNNRNELRVLASTFFESLNVDIGEHLPRFIKFISNWMMSKMSLAEDLLPENVQDVFKVTSEFVSDQNLKSTLRKDNSAFDVLMVNAAAEFAFFTNPAVRDEKGRPVAIEEEIWTEDYLQSLAGLNVNHTEPLRNQFCLDDRCAHISNIRRELLYRILSVLSNDMDMLGSSPPPIIFPHEIALPSYFIESKRRDFHHVTTFMDEWLGIKVEHRNSWLTWCAFKTVQLIANTALVNIDSLSDVGKESGEQFADSLKTNFEALLPLMAASSNLQFFDTRANWTMLTWSEMRSVSILQLALAVDAADEQIDDALISFAMQAEDAPVPLN